MLQKIFFLMVFLLFSRGVLAEQCIPWGKYAEKKEKTAQLTIGKILIKSIDVFDLTNKKEKTILHRWANKVHIQTQDAVIQRQLLFAVGDTFQIAKLNESGRLLRANKYIKDATVLPLEVCGDQVTVEVSTQDNWTLTPGLSFGRSGGESKSGIKIQEHNLFGLGKSLSLSYKKNIDRNSLLFAYNDPQLLGSRKQLFAAIQDNSDGKAYTLALGLPFYAFDSKRSWGLKASSSQQENSVYDHGEVAEKIGNESTKYTAFYGWSKGIKNNSVSRFKVGWKYIQDRYNDTATSTSTTQPTSLVESYPLFGYELFEERFITKTNFKTMASIEDVSLGQHFTAEIGLLHQQMGSDDNHLKLSASYAKGYELGAKDLGFIAFDTTTYLGKGLRQGESIALKGEWYSFNEEGNDYYLKGQLAIANNLQVGGQLLLGEDNGLRGYPIGYQSGDKSALLTFERRFRFNWHPLHLIKFGAVAFADVGSAWGGDRNDNNIHFLSDVGFGFRIVPTRSSSAKSIHFDFAIPLNDQSEVDGYQFLMTTKQSF